MGIYPEIQTGKLWSVEGEIYELFDMRVTAPTSPTCFITTAFFKSLNPDSTNPFFEEKISNILAQPEIFKRHHAESKQKKPK